MNGSDCGIFVAMFMERLSHRIIEFDFSQEDMPRLRDQMAREIASQALV